MNSPLLNILILAAVALFLVLRLRNILGTRDGFEGQPKTAPKTTKRSRDQFEVIEGGGEDRDIADHVDVDSIAGKALAAMKRSEPSFSVSEFAHGARQAYEMILMAYEKGDLEFLQQYLAPDVYESFAAAINDRADKGLTVDASFVGVREITLRDAKFDADNSEAEITMKFVGELTSVVKDAEGRIVEGDPDTIKRQTDIWTFARLMGGENPNWLLVGTGE